MKIFFIEHKENHPLSYSIEHFCFQIDFEFYLIVYPSYYNGYDSFELKNSFIEQVITKKKTCVYKFDRGYELKQIKKDIIEGKVFKGKMNEVISVYQNATGKEFCYYRSLDYIEWINLFLNYTDRYNEAVQIIDNCEQLLNKEGVLLSLQKLYSSNRSELKWASSFEQIKITELLSKSFIKKLKNNG